MSERILILHNIRSALNVGAIFRTADAVGITKIVFAGYTPLPVDRFGFPDKQIAKTALGAQLSVPWERQDNITELIHSLKQKGTVIVGLELDPRAVDYKSFTPKGDIAVILGEEVEGLSSELRDICSVLLELPMKGTKESLNVSVAAGILLYRLFDRDHTVK